MVVVVVVMVVRRVEGGGAKGVTPVEFVGRLLRAKSDRKIDRGRCTSGLKREKGRWSQRATISQRSVPWTSSPPRKTPAAARVSRLANLASCSSPFPAHFQPHTVESGGGYRELIGARAKGRAWPCKRRPAPRSKFGFPDEICTLGRPKGP